MAGNIGKVKIWTPINMADPKLVANHRVKAWLQERRDNWLVYRNNYITLGSAKIAAPKTNKAVTHPSDDIRMSLSALSQRFDHKDPSQNKAAQTGALTAIGEYFKKNPFEFESGINHLVDNLSANQLQQLRKNSAALLEGTELKSLLHGKDEEETEKIIGFLTEVHNRCDSTLMLKKGFNHHELSPAPHELSPAPHELSPAPQVGGVHSDSESSEVESSNSDDNENSSNYSEVDNSPSVAPPPQLDEPPPFPSTLPLAKDKPAGGFPEMVPNDKTTPTVKTKPTPATSFKEQVVRQRLQSSLDPKLQKRSGEPQSRRPSSPPLGPLTPDEFDSLDELLTEKDELDDFVALLDDANAKDKKRAADLNEKRAWHSAARKAPPLIPNDRRSADLTKPDGLATPAQDLEKSESLSTVPKGLSEPATIDEPRTEAKTPAAPLWTDGHQAEADRRAAGVAAAGLVNAINSKNTGWFFKHLNELSNPAFEPNIGDALKAAVGKNSLSNLSHYKSMMNALEEGRDAWSGFSKDKKDRIDAMLTLWKNILVEERGNAPPPAAVSRTYYQGTIHLLAGTDLPKPPVR